MVEPSEEAIMRGVSALLPFVQEWNLSLNPENLDLLAYAVLWAVSSDVSHREVDAKIRALIADDRERYRLMHEAMGSGERQTPDR